MSVAATYPRIAFGIDSAGPLRASQGYLRLSGWVAGSAAPHFEARIRLGDTASFDCRMGITRSDVAAAYPGLPGATESGFAIEAYLPVGLHLATLDCRPAGSPAWTPLRTFSVLSELSSLLVTLESVIPTDSEPGAIFIHGWAFHPQSEVESIQVRFGQLVSSLTYGLARKDVSELIPWNRQAANSGFEGQLHLQPGSGPVTLVAKLRDGAVLEHVLAPELTVPDADLEAAIHRANESRAGLISLPQAPLPSVSIIIPVYNQLELTLACLESLVKQADGIPFEVIVIDDHSVPETFNALSNVRFLRLYRNELNQGFVLNCNRGAAEAKGHYLVFLNNDTVVTKGWLKALQDVFTLKPDAGLVGAKLLFPDGRLQEAGNLLWSDGSAWNFGRGENPDQPEFNYLRRADYCSGACIMIKRDVFNSVGGFDPLYCPAYYEDADLGLKVRAAGFQVYYQPECQIIHYEGMSSGKSTASGVKRHQVTNQEKFLAKWETTLSKFGDGPHLAAVARDRHYSDRILVVDACALTPDMDAGSVRMFNMLKILAEEGMKVTFAAENLQFHEPFSTELQKQGIEHLGVPSTYSLEAYLEQNGFAFDIILISRKAITAKFLPVVRRVAPQAKVIFDTVDLMFLRLSRQAKIEKSADLETQAATSRIEELALARAADLTYVVSEEEAAVLARDVPAEKLAVVPLINPTRLSGLNHSDRWGILFVGGFQHPPNLDAILFFLDEVLPFVRLEIPNVEVHIVGSRTPPALLARREKNVQIHGFVADLDSLLDRVRLSIAPLRYGAGVKGKINQSMACGVPVVSTTIGIEGMHLVSEQNCLVADDPKEFASQIVRLHSDPDLWSRLRSASIAHVDKHFSFSRVRTQLRESFLRIGALGRRTPGELPSRPVEDLPPDMMVACTPDTRAMAYLGGGWDRAQASHSWSIAPKATMRFRVPSDHQGYRFQMELFPLLVEGRVARQRVEVLAVGTGDSASWVLDHPGITAVEFTFTIQSRHQGLVELEFRFPDACKPSTLGLSADERCLAVGLVRFGVSRS